MKFQPDTMSCCLLLVFFGLWHLAARFAAGCPGSATARRKRERMQRVVQVRRNQEGPAAWGAWFRGGACAPGLRRTWATSAKKRHQFFQSYHILP